MPWPEFRGGGAAVSRKGSNMKPKLWSALAFLLMCATTSLLAQRTGGGVAGGAHPGGGFVASPARSHGESGKGGFGSGRGFRVNPARRGVIGGHSFSPHGFHQDRFRFPYWGTAYWWDYPYADDGDQPPAQPPVTSLAVQPTAPTPAEEVKPANPLLIELQGNRFVRLTDGEINQPLLASGQASASPQQGQLPPVVLVFRDGRHQEVVSYSIIGPALYASGSYWTNGYWTQKILLADLDLPATLRANQKRGVNFILPAAPDQVVTRP